MANIGGSVGKGGGNAPPDVKQVQQLLRKFVSSPGCKELDITADGKMGKATEKAIEVFQKQMAGISRPDSLVEPGGKTWKALNGSATAPPKEEPPKGKSPKDPKKLSGAAWWKANEGRYPNCSKVSDLSGSFQAGVRTFIAALEAAGASIDISSTLRNKDRAWLMYWCWQISRGKVKADRAPTNANVDIVWDHGDDRASQRGAKEMADLFHLKYEPSRTSRHIEGNAIDMDISWSGKIDVAAKKGPKVSIGSPNNGADNDDLHKVGASYGVVKLKSDPPHWSNDGR